MKNFKILPKKTKNLLNLGLIVFLVIVLPLLVWTIINLNFNQREKAATGEPGICIDVNKVITVTPATSEGNDPNDFGCHNIQYAIDAAIGDGYTILITPGEYFMPEQINVINKSNITIKGDETRGSGGTVLTFDPGRGFNFLIQNTSGTIQWMTIRGGSSNGMVSIQNSNNFSVAYASIYSQTSHTMDIQNSNNISVYNTEIQSSAGALEVSNSHGVNISNNRIHNSDNAISVFNSSARIASNLIYENFEDGIRLNKPVSVDIYSNTVANNQGSGLEIRYVEPTYETIVYVYKNIFSNNKYGVYTDSTITSVDSFRFDFNDVWANTQGNYSGINNKTGVNGNISSDPLFGSDYCVYSGSPVLYGLISNGEYMGSRNYCSGTSLPSPSPTPTGTVRECLRCTTNLDCISGLICRSFVNGPSGCTDDGAGHTVCYDPSVTFLCAKPDGTSQCTPIITPSPSPTSSPTPRVGDVNNDGHVNLIDIGMVIDEYDKTNPSNPRVDVNGNGKVDLIDIGLIIDNYEW